MEKHVKTSKYLALILRHDPSRAGIVLDNHGWCNIDKLLSGMHISRKVLDEVVSTDEKRRYTISADGKKIRAAQGHSVPIDLDLEEVVPPDILYHGTNARSLKSIREHGLNRMHRQFVHLSSTRDLAMAVGARRGDPLVLSIEAKRMSDVGHNFYLSENNVWLCYHIPPEFIVF